MQVETSMNIVAKVLLVTFVLFSPQRAFAGDVEQTTLCTTASWKAADNVGKCKEGQKIAFLPSSFGNEQLPILFIALNCDVRFSVSLTNGGAICVFKPVEKVVEL